MLFLVLYMDQIYILHEKYVRAFSFVYNRKIVEILCFYFVSLN